MPEINLNKKGNELNVTGIPGKTEPLKIRYPSDEANDIIFEAAEERQKSAEQIVESLFEGKTIEF